MSNSWSAEYKADTRIVDPRTGEVIACPGDTLDDETLYRLERIAINKYYQNQIDEVWREMEIGSISPAVADLRIAYLMFQAGWRQAGSISYRAR